MVLAFWLSLFLVFYTFFGYGILLFALVRIRIMLKGKRAIPELGAAWPTLTLIVAAYNEEAWIREKISNTLQLDYPADKIHYVFVTDGSSDSTPDIIAEFPQIRLMHEPARNGKIAAMERAMKTIDTEVVVFTDANTTLNKMALKNIARHYADPTVGAVSGEKRVQIEEVSDATAGEGFYWKYESKLKTWDSELYSVVGAAGELFSVRTSLYEPVEPDTILDDFMISMLIAKKGYRIIYEPAAYASETGSENIGEELKRKIRIAAGGIQSIVRLRSLLIPYPYFVLSFQYVSHRVLRWTITPFLMIAAVIMNWIILGKTNETIYTVVFALQLLFYIAAYAGWRMEKSKVRIKALFIPYYFCMMNYAVMAGIKRYLQKNQAVTWEKAKRKQ